MSVCELCDKDVPPNEARYWLICHSCRRGLGMGWKKLELYCLDSDELKAWRRMTTIYWSRKKEWQALRQRKIKRESREPPSPDERMEELEDGD